MRHLVRWLLLLSLMSGGLGGGQVEAAAKTGKEAVDETAPLSVKALLPENQRSSDVTYYDVRVTPGQQQTLQLQLLNHTATDQRVHLQLNPAKTDRYGQLTYKEPLTPTTRDASLQVAITDIASIEEAVTVPAHDSLKVPITLTLPETTFNGEVLGGIYIQPEGEPRSETDGAQLSNQLAYMIGLRVTETDTVLTERLDLTGVKATQVAGQNKLVVSLHNPVAKRMDDLSYQVTVTQTGSVEAVAKATLKGYRFAPNSTGEVLLDLGQTALHAGTYDLAVTARSGQSDQTWEWQVPLTLTHKEAEAWRASLPQAQHPWRWIGGLGIGLLLVGVGSVWGYRRLRAKAATPVRPVTRPSQGPHAKNRRKKRPQQKGESSHDRHS